MAVRWKKIFPISFLLLVLFNSSNTIQESGTLTVTKIHKLNDHGHNKSFIILKQLHASPHHFE